ncbi:MAG: hypothetical protein PHO57_12360, partial [Acidithiobacillus sp.]|nr:hypothetical protein [Acidithiobacillus sp.]
IKMPTIVATSSEASFVPDLGTQKNSVLAHNIANYQDRNQFISHKNTFLSGGNPQLLIFRNFWMSCLFYCD